MASRKFEKGSSEWLMFQDFWKLCQRFWEVEDNDEYWEEVVKEANEFYEKHKEVDEKFAMKLALGYIDSLESRYKEGKNK